MIRYEAMDTPWSRDKPNSGTVVMKTDGEKVLETWFFKDNPDRFEGLVDDLNNLLNRIDSLKEELKVVNPGMRF